ncbi:AAA family ATPase [Streptomyces sp. DSM 44917]|uniref:AAA family ATPase n=1 Tax=Streptomyces boetiae TaxID=3075541 RepID=A0ABU2L4N4_9ACTN|nr:AAA family ATPase [Streptomyces sp. DSM 44917]MDT0306477.1 AAA family ATPase [Streptomyces sp. DSM 44917]
MRHEALRELRDGGSEALREVREGTDAALREVRGRTGDALAELGRARAGSAVERLTAESGAKVRGMLDEGRAALLDFALDEAARLFAEPAPPVMEVVLPGTEAIRVTGHRHRVLPDVLRVLDARCHALLVGPAGTGESMMAKQAAEALGLEFQALSLGPTTPMSKIFGYYDADGHYHATPFRRAFEHGGLMPLVELDSGPPGLPAELNQALAIGTCAFADGMVTAHPGFGLVATANTYGTGGDRQDVGRQALDAATLDRFVIVDVPVDEELEERIALAHAPDRQEEAREVVREVRGLRSAAAEKRLPVTFPPHASVDAAKPLQAGADVEQAFQWRVVRGMSDGHRAALGIGS